MPRLALRTQGGRSKFIKRSYAALRRSFNRKVAASAVANARTEYAKVMCRYVTAVTHAPKVAPLTFQKPTRLVVKSDAEKKRAVI